MSRLQCSLLPSSPARSASLRDGSDLVHPRLRLPVSVLAAVVHTHYTRPCPPARARYSSETRSGSHWWRGRDPVALRDKFPLFPTLPMPIHY
ncbi:Peroxisomal adenine nucleotide transporter 1 [Frankliniella fusca]|uniref:Peroxisomal adenine nucleotide transporter 1 n=1 Tax=Frankliniella fusca TaxID=407009 RepID=A0AAE1L7D9_9NEOP|nr:Peroxisomal adenine nucleotide transporter 1 [Frankliniella fusca]